MAGFWGKKRRGLKSKCALFLRLFPKVFFESFFELIIGLLELCDAPTFCKPSELSAAHFVNLLLSHWRWFGQSLLQSLIQLCADRHPAEILQKAAHQMLRHKTTAASGNSTQFSAVPAVETIHSGLQQGSTRSSNTQMLKRPRMGVIQDLLVSPSEAGQKDIVDRQIRESFPDSPSLSTAEKIGLGFLFGGRGVPLENPLGEASLISVVDSAAELRFFRN